jgi:uncharacterized protein involved in outer membrane biogenesis
MIKKVLIVLVVLAVLVAGGVYWAYNRLDVIAHYAIEHYGSEITGVSVKVKDVELNPADGRGGLKGVEIGTPRGFGAPRTARLGEIRVSVDPATVTSDLVIIREITIEAPEISYEKGPGGTNLDAIQKNIEAYLKKSDQPADGKPTGPQAPGRRYVIEKFSIRNAKVTMTGKGMKGQGITFTLPNIELRDLGKRPNGITAGQAANIVANALISRIAQRVLSNIELLRQGGKEGVLDALRGIFK